jgi:hypothetical protein
MTAPEPDLFDMAVEFGRTVPEDRRVGIARLIEGKRMIPVPRGAPQMVIVKAMGIGTKAPEDRDTQAQRLARPEGVQR